MTSTPCQCQHSSSSLRTRTILLLVLAFSILLFTLPLFDFDGFSLPLIKTTMRSTSNSTTTKSKTVPLEHKEAEAESVSGSGSKKTLQCIWKPGDDDSCLHLVSEQIDASLLRTSAVPLEQHRWLFLGDSTMSRLFANYGLKRHFIDTAPIRKVCPQYSCNQISTGRCNTNEVFQLARRQDGQWSSPDYTRGEGPIKFGMENPYCQDWHGSWGHVVDWCRAG